jgi:hypothetical protein
MLLRQSCKRSIGDSERPRIFDCQSWDSPSEESQNAQKFAKCSKASESAQ